MNDGFRTRQRRSEIREIGIVSVDGFYEKAACLFVASRSHTERSKVDVIGWLPCIATYDEGIQGAQLAHHLGDHIVQFVAIRDAVNKGQIAVARLRPIDALHVAVIKVVALQTPSV